jgi:hypothetical protein
LCSGIQLHKEFAASCRIPQPHARGVNDLMSTAKENEGNRMSTVAT